MTANEDLDFTSADLGATEDFLARAYTKMSIGRGPGERPTTRIVRKWLGPISFDELELDYHMSYDADPLNRICLCRVHSGRIEENFIGEPQDVFGPGDVTLFSPPELPYSGRVCRAAYDLTMFDPELLDRVATTGPGEAGGPVRLTGHRPVSPQAGYQLKVAIEYVRSVVQGRPVPALLASTTASMLAATVVSTMPTNAGLEPGPTDRRDAKPALLRRAIAYIEANADRDIALADIAEAVYVTPRALQYMFRRHLELSPMGYLRQVRLSHARQQLLNADPATTTVQAVAARWGFAHTGRFAAAYRRTFGENPSDTLN
ncbi:MULTISPECIES: helix-turn-helix transcriptional regulator [Mycolicibacterium]|uniref:AraC family transcriptional regulator n=1 Tax=Mycolicibacterium fortuitum TaxID=1766 RepID=A0ABD6QJX1_MYCFO|nr:MULTISPECIES: helix-turn-helix transcriptional regulator [Mycolicibacterium]NOP97499.1 helix-turn-helix domain-containing protein [Mycolicibacterium fortuitum]OBA91733.1 AraC family transcriptional regulator [Mycolicibacterium fortuitum]OBI54368.1 AraC family transcriptional regulator [Mycolicibacterium fortuitum]OBI70386.1 AraC family transcriptional regulator [Mycolicibacterium fortuitum]OBK02510.1 AraC family transcriptional regulator [Mycolicibacterium fortuitum]